MSWFDTPADEGGATSENTGWFGRVNSFFDDPAREARWNQRKLDETHDALDTKIWWEGVRERRNIAEGEAMRDEKPAYWAERSPHAMPKPILHRAVTTEGVPETRFADTFFGIAKPGDKRLPPRALRSRPEAEGCGWHRGNDAKYWTEVTSDGHLTIRYDKHGNLVKYEGSGIRICDKCNRQFRETSGRGSVHRQPASHRATARVADAVGIDRVLPANWKWIQRLVGHYMIRGDFRE